MENEFDDESFELSKEIDEDPQNIEFGDTGFDRDQIAALSLDALQQEHATFARDFSATFPGM